MTYRGRVQDGVVVFEGDQAPAEGTIVHIEPIASNARDAARGTPNTLRTCTARWAGDPAKLDRLLDDVQAMRNADLA